MTATDTVTDGPLIELPPEAGDVNAVVFEPDDDWLRRATPDEQKTAMWRWFATRYEDPREPESAGPQDATGERVLAGEDSDIEAARVLHERFDPCVPPPVVEQLVQRVQRHAGPTWARKGIDKFGG